MFRTKSKIQVGNAVDGGRSSAVHTVAAKRAKTEALLWMALSTGLMVSTAGAAHIKCGDTIGAGESDVLHEDIGPCPAPFALRVDSGTLDLNGFRVSCARGTDGGLQGVGLSLGGTGSHVRNGRVDACSIGVLLLGARLGEGRSRVEFVRAQGHIVGFAVENDDNRLSHNVAMGCRVGFSVSANDNDLRDNLAIQNATGFANNRGDRNTYFNNAAVLNDPAALALTDFGGFVVTRGSDNQFSNNSSTANAGPGFLVSGTALRTSLTGNRSVANGRHGFAISGGTENRVEGNTSLANDHQGIVVLSQRNVISHNQSKNNRGRDMSDLNHRCDNNEWRTNDFITASQTCIH